MRNLMQHPLRTCTALGGIIFAIFLVFLQLGFLHSVRTASTMLYDYFNFDLAVVATGYQFLYAPPDFDRIRLFQARSLPEIDDVFHLNITTGRWSDGEGGLRSSLLLIGVDQKPHFIRNRAIHDGLQVATDRRTILLDSYSHPDFGHRTIGSEGLVNGHEAHVGGLFQLGLFFYAEGAALVDNNHFHYFADSDRRRVNVGLLRVRAGSDVEAIREHLDTLLPDDVMVLTRTAFIQREQNYFVSIKPIGIIFQAGVFIALLIGVVILFQVLSADIANRMTEFATLKATGFSNLFVYGVGAFQTLFFALGALPPAILISHGTFALIAHLSHLPITLNGAMVGTVFAWMVVMGLFAALVTLQRLRRADPAVLF